MLRQRRVGMLLAFMLGLAVATAGTATAAKLITGKQIKNGSIARKDLSTAVRAELSESAEPGAQGPQGIQGPKGDRGPAGVVPAPQTPITVTSFQNGWTLFGTDYQVTYWKDASGVVHLTGGLTGGTVSVGITSVPIFRLPAGYRPAHIQYFPVVSTGGAPDYTPVGGAYLEICSVANCSADHAGEIAVFGADNDYFSLDGITFRAG